MRWKDNMNNEQARNWKKAVVTCLESLRKTVKNINQDSV
jgi:hypothetical protein